MIVKKIFLLLVGLVASEVAYAQSSSLNLAIPSSPQSFQTDRVRSSDNIECQMAIGSSTNVEFGVVGIIGEENPFASVYDPNYSYQISNRSRMKDVGVYAKITIPIGAPKKRLDCTHLYELELVKKRLEVQRLQAEINQLRALQFEGDRNRTNQAFEQAKNGN